MTDSELIEHMHARGWNVGTIDVPMIREACAALSQRTEQQANPWRQAVDEALIAHALAGKVDASRVRDEALEEAAQLYGEGEVAAPGGHSQWGDAHQEGWIDGTKAYRDAIRSLIGTPKSAEGEGA
jgi:hypothetical protein